MDTPLANLILSRGKSLTSHPTEPGAQGGASWNSSRNYKKLIHKIN